MTSQTFHIATLHRGRYMIFLLIGVSLVTAIVARLPIIEIAKILSVLLTLPILIYLSTRLSRNHSEWTLTNKHLHIRFPKKNQEEIINLLDIKYLRNVPRSGGNLIMFFLREKKSPQRYWRNKLFEKMDDLESLIHQLRQHGVEYYYM